MTAQANWKKEDWKDYNWEIYKDAKANWWWRATAPAWWTENSEEWQLQGNEWKQKGADWKQPKKDASAWSVQREWQGAPAWANWEWVEVARSDQGFKSKAECEVNARKHGWA